MAAAVVVATLSKRFQTTASRRSRCLAVGATGKASLRAVRAILATIVAEGGASRTAVAVVAIVGTATEAGEEEALVAEEEGVEAAAVSAVAEEGATAADVVVVVEVVAGPMQATVEEVTATEEEDSEEGEEGSTAPLLATAGPDRVGAATPPPMAAPGSALETIAE